MKVAERRAARLEGWRVAFCPNDRRMRGCPSIPGLMMSLDRVGTCAGVALRMGAGEDAHAALVDLLQKEQPVPPERVTVEADAGSRAGHRFRGTSRLPDLPSRAGHRGTCRHPRNGRGASGHDAFVDPASVWPVMARDVAVVPWSVPASFEIGYVLSQSPHAHSARAAFIEKRKQISVQRHPVARASSESSAAACHLCSVCSPH